MRVLALDPGPTRIGAALLELPPMASWPRVIRAGHVELDEARRWVAEAVALGHHVAVETIVGYAYQASRVAGLVETARVEGRLLEAARPNSDRLLHAVEASVWRESMLGTRTPSDDQIRVVVEGVVRDIPQLGCRVRPHAYDAMGLALYVMAKERSGRGAFRLPPETARKLFLLQQQEKAERAAKPRGKTKRAPTRSQTTRRSQAAVAAWAKRRAET